MSKQTDSQRDDALFEALGKSKKKRKRKIIITIVSIVLVVAIVAVLGVSFLQRRVREQFAASSAEVTSYTAATGTISTVVSGSGTISDVDPESITVPDGVEITEVLAQRNSAVAEGDILATVDMGSVMSAMADLQAQIEELDEQISEAEDDEVSTYIYAGVSGRVKYIYAEEDVAVADTMYESGALALISLDGTMAVDITTDALASGDEVTVRLSDESEVSGTVKSVVGGTATILVTDNGPAYDEEVTVLTAGGTSIGSGKLYIHNALRVTGYAGTVDVIRVDVNDTVSDSTKLFTLEDTGTSANYDALLRSRSEIEETLLELLTIQKNGAVLAPFSGSVYSVDHTEGGTAVATLSRDESMSVTISVDESDILSLALGQDVDVTVSSVSEDAFTGTLTEIDRTSSTSGTYSAVITMDKTDGMLSGMTASVSIKIEGVENAILIPTAALNQTRDTYYVYTEYDEQTQTYSGMTEVTVGLSNSNYVEITSGLSEGDTVYYTETESITGMFGGMGGFGDTGGMSGEDFGGGGSGGRTPDNNGGQMPSGGQMPGGSGEMPNQGGGGSQMPGGAG